MAEKGDKADPVASLENKLATLEKKFAELEKKYSHLQAKEANGEDSVSKSVSEKKTEKNSTTNGLAPEAEVDSSPKARVRVVTNRIDPDTQERKDFEPEQLPETVAKKNTEQALLLRRFVYADEDGDGDIIIYDEGLRGLLYKLLPHYPAHWRGEIVTIPSPYEAIILNWDLLWEQSEPEKECGDNNSRQVRADLRELLETLQKSSGDLKLDKYLQNRNSYQKERCITFEALWTIFPPGTIVYGHLFLKRDQIFIVQDNYRPWPKVDPTRRSGSTSWWRLRCWTYDYDGEVFSRRAITLDFEEFENTKPIASLPFLPLDEHERRTEIEDALFKRGEAFRKYCTTTTNNRMYGYDGDAIFDSAGFRGVKTNEMGDRDWDRDRDRDTYIPQRASKATYPIKKGGVMVDFRSYYRYGLATSQIGDTLVQDEQYDCQCPDCVENEALQSRYRQKYDCMKGGEDEEWEKLQTMLCPPRVLGYVLKDKQWAQLAVDKLQPLPDEEEKTVMKRLHLSGGTNDDGEEMKELLCGLVRYHGIEGENGTQQGYGIKDIVPDKGKGLVILLYGNPGVGKPSTAQMIAQAVKKPLFSVSVGDVGTTAKDVERNLQTIFELASIWRAILLIDEADVFLQSRTAGSFSSAERSGLVSVFLRVLEYYRGILFLTTNQIAQFDVAVQSRIHIALKYIQLTKVQTTSIFKDFVEQYRKQGRVGATQREIENFAATELFKKRFDGRQIRNIVTTAMGYARGIGEEKMSLEHIRHVVGFVDEFKTDLSAQLREWEMSQGKTSYKTP
ncbi:MAG: hypothetical protein M1822_003733 [Bathelium mastoideum]|nr:MAG: hypothetical protein M1822_003733 [Bathelium mastoideum]